MSFVCIPCTWTVFGRGMQLPFLAREVSFFFWLQSSQAKWSEKAVCQDESKKSFKKFKNGNTMLLVEINQSQRIMIRMWDSLKQNGFFFFFTVKILTDNYSLHHIHVIKLCFCGYFSTHFCKPDVNNADLVPLYMSILH